MSRTQREKTMVLVEGAIVIAISAILNLIQFKGPWAAGGGISLEMVPLIVYALRRGFVWGIFAGFIYGFVNFIEGPYYLNPIQYLLDYGLAFLLVGFAGLIVIKDSDSRSVMFWKAGLATVISMVLKFLSHYVSGIVFYGSNAPAGQPVALYSLIYNGSYVGPSMIFDLIVMILLASAIPKYLVRR
ncbi:energy-coupled thiamine transporter ThiT [Tuberibacillus calidus]|uniref:energy-coupled thiamine transporter ThiT n=1 Tax=Tuberibacillus calidus TaxID=340097 RepID=UPI000427460F|nr:energy-coupled thiamine transporter ThiT [Tuberibacillus calidus]